MTATKLPAPPPPADAHPSGRVRLLERPDGDSPGLVEIVTADRKGQPVAGLYWLWADWSNPGHYQIQGRKSESSYHVVAARRLEAGACDCPDADFRDRPCKHARAVRAVALAHGLPVEGGAL